MRRGRDEGRVVRVTNYRSQWDPLKGSHERDYNWRDDAACQSLPAEIFEVALEGDPQVEEMSLEEIVRRNEDSFEMARRACSGCPVAPMCLDEASKDEQYWTVRGGRRPGALNNLLRTALDEDGLPWRRCPSGHRNWKHRPKAGYFECRTCKSELDKGRNRRAATLEG